MMIREYQATKEVLVQSKHSAILVKLKQQKTKYKLDYTLPLGVEDASAPSLEDMKSLVMLYLLIGNKFLPLVLILSLDRTVL